MYGHNNFPGINGMGYFMSGGGVMFILFLFIIAVLIFYFIKNNQNINNQESINSANRNDDALNILKKRFANSEISEDEYLSKKEILTK